MPGHAHPNARGTESCRIDVIGGTVTTPGGVTYAAFGSGADEGVYALGITWADIIRLDELADYAADVEFKAVFYDASGNTRTASVTVGLTCASSAPDICDEACTDTDDALSHCGSCGNDCVALETEDDATQICMSGTCFHYVMSCNETGGAGYPDCDAACAAVGLPCASGGSWHDQPDCSDSSSTWVTCDTDLTPYPADAVRCECYGAM